MWLVFLNGNIGADLASGGVAGDRSAIAGRVGSSTGGIAFLTESVVTTFVLLESADTPRIEKLGVIG